MFNSYLKVFESFFSSFPIKDITDNQCIGSEGLTDSEMPGILGLYER